MYAFETSPLEIPSADANIVKRNVRHDFDCKLPSYLRFLPWNRLARTGFRVRFANTRRCIDDATENRITPGEGGFLSRQKRTPSYRREIIIESGAILVTRYRAVSVLLSHDSTTVSPKARGVIKFIFPRLYLVFFNQLGRWQISWTPNFSIPRASMTIGPHFVAHVFILNFRVLLNNRQERW